MIDPKDLRQVKASEFKLQDNVFYKKNASGGFDMCKIFKDEFKDPLRAEILRYETTKFAEQGLLYTRINRPWKAFE